MFNDTFWPPQMLTVGQDTKWSNLTLNKNIFYPYAASVDNEVFIAGFYDYSEIACKEIFNKMFKVMKAHLMVMRQENSGN